MYRKRRSWTLSRRKVWTRSQVVVPEIVARFIPEILACLRISRSVRKTLDTPV
jgi:hypothetical protein